jgi:hypothetical protein
MRIIYKPVSEGLVFRHFQLSHSRCVIMLRGQLQVIRPHGGRVTVTVANKMLPVFISVHRDQISRFSQSSSKSVLIPKKSIRNIIRTTSYHFFRELGASSFFFR